MTQPTLRRSGHAPVNGVELYYEIHGPQKDVPLVLLHGGGSTIDVTYSQTLPLFARNRAVIALDEQGHGRSTARPGPATFEASADDVAALLDFLRIPQADVMGFSNGASVALQLTLRHPGKVRKLVFASAMTQRDGAHSQLWDFMEHAEFSSMPQPLKDAFLKVNPDQRKLHEMHDRDAARMRSFRDVPDEQVAGVRIPVLILLGDRDVVKPEHGIELTRLFPHARLMILPAGHGDYLSEAVTIRRVSRFPELSAGLIELFLDGLPDE